jgi:hypothetical protein
MRIVRNQVGAKRFRSLSRGESGSALAAFREVEAFDGCAFLVVVPGFDHDERQRMSRIEITCVEMKRVLECLAAAALHVPIEAPLCA